MRAVGNILGPAIGFAVLFALLAGGWFLFKYVANVFSTLEPQVETLAAIASAVALLCAVIIAEGLKARARAEGDSSAGSEKAREYERLLLLCCEQVQERSNAAATEAELARLEKFLMLHASAKVLAAYAALRRVLRQGEAKTASPTLVKLLIEMRNDLGRTEFIRNEDELADIMLNPPGQDSRPA